MNSFMRAVLSAILSAALVAPTSAAGSSALPGASGNPRSYGESRGVPLPAWGDARRGEVPFRAPLWKTGLIFPDISMWNDVDNWDALDRASHGIIAMKVRQSEVDPLFHRSLDKAEARGMIVLGYAFGYNDSGAAQADALLRAFPMRPGRILVLDLERNPFGSSMSTGQAMDFVRRIRERTGRYPMLYTAASRGRPGVLGKCPRWVASWGDQPDEAAVWQFTDGRVGPGPHTIPGIGHVDLNRLMISYGALRRLAGIDDGEVAPGMVNDPWFQENHPARTRVLRRVNAQLALIRDGRAESSLTRQEAAALTAEVLALREEEERFAKRHGKRLTRDEYRRLDRKLERIRAAIEAERRD